MARKIQTGDRNEVIKEALKKIVLGTSYNNIEGQKSKHGMGGIGTARVVDGWVSKIHDNPADPEYEDYAGTIDVTEFIEKNTNPIVHKGVRLSGKDGDNSFLIVPYLHSDVSIVVDATSSYKHLVSYSHVDIMQIHSHSKSTIGAIETEPLNVDDNDSPDYDELPRTGNESGAEYTVDKIVTFVKDKNGGVYIKENTSSGYNESIKGDGSDVNISVGKDGVVHSVGDTSVSISDGYVYLGGKSDEPAVYGIKLSIFMKKMLTNISQIMTPTLMGTMPIINIQDFVSMITETDSFLSDTVFIK